MKQKIREVIVGALMCIALVALCAEPLEGVDNYNELFAMTKVIAFTSGFISVKLFKKWDCEHDDDDE